MIAGAVAFDAEDETVRIVLVANPDVDEIAGDAQQRGDDRGGDVGSRGGGQPFIKLESGQLPSMDGQVHNATR